MLWDSSPWRGSREKLDPKSAVGMEKTHPKNPKRNPGFIPQIPTQNLILKPAPNPKRNPGFISQIPSFHPIQGATNIKRNLGFIPQIPSRNPPQIRDLAHKFHPLIPSREPQIRDLSHKSYPKSHPGPCPKPRIYPRNPIPKFQKTRDLSHKSHPLVPSLGIPTDPSPPGGIFLFFRRLQRQKCSRNVSRMSTNTATAVRAARMVLELNSSRIRAGICGI